MRAIPLVGLALLSSCTDARQRELSEPVEGAAQGASERALFDQNWPPSIPRWRAYLDGEDYYLDKGRKTYFRGPESGGSIVLVRESDLDNPERWFWLHLGESQQKGAGYLHALMREQGLAPEDLIGILFALERAGDEPPLITTLAQPQHTRDAFEGGGDRPLLPLPSWDNDHRGGPVSPSPGAPRGGRAPKTPARPGRAPFNPADPSTQRPHPRNGAERRRVEELAKLAENGVRPGDPPPTPSPLDDAYAPSPGEERETFKCEGDVYYGYKNACVDCCRSPFLVIPRSLHLG
jgi:hypothetical protein